MLKLTRYLKPYIALLLLALAVLCAQVLMDLNLPNLMSQIVNVGIMKNGIQEVVPKALAPDSFALLRRFMPPKDAEIALDAYVPSGELTEQRRKETQELFPEAVNRGALVLVQNGEDPALALAFARAGFALLMYTREESPSLQGGADAGPAAMAALAQKIASLPDTALAPLVKQAAATPQSVLFAGAGRINQMFYRQLGADIGAIQTAYLLKTGGWMLLLSFGVVACALLVGFCFARIGAGVSKDLRRDIFAKVSSFTNAELDHFSTSSLITRTTNDVTQVQTMYTMGLRMLVQAPLMGAGAVVMALRKSQGMSWVLALAVILIMGLMAVMLGLMTPRFKKMQVLVDRLNQVARENLTGMMVVRAFSNQDFQQRRFERANDALAGNNLFVNRVSAMLMPLLMLVMNGLSLLIVWLGASQIAQGNLQVGDLMAFIQYSMQMIMSFVFLSFVSMVIPRASVSAQRIREVLDSEASIRDPEKPETLGGRAYGEVQFDHVSFRYEGAKENALCDISFTARPGETTALIGATGSGKTTLLNLILRFYDVCEGAVKVDGVDVRSLAQHELRQNIGYVPQKGLLFSGTAESNLLFGDRNASPEKLQEAAEIAQATEFIGELPGGMQGEISQGGTSLSGGQRQRMAIARALVKDAPIYLFDDSFAALDFATDARLRAALKPHTAKATVLVVAQRVSTIRNAHQIVVLDEGRVVGIGTHAQLMLQCETYREIAQSQLSKEELA